MNLASFKQKINDNPQWKKQIHHFMFCNARPRLWVKWLVNPWVFHHGKGVTIRWQTVLNVSPINIFHIGAYSTVEEYCIIDNGVGNVIIGDYTRIGLRDTLIGPVEIGNHVIIAQNVVLSGLNHRYEDISKPVHLQGITAKKITVEKEVWIGANSMISAGVTIGEHSIVAGGSVVTKNVPPFSVVAGNPAKIIKKYDSELKQWMRI
ncbi:MAG: acyltransferase [Bacteroidaceae bacterium]